MTKQDKDLRLSTNDNQETPTTKPKKAKKKKSFKIATILPYFNLLLSLVVLAGVGAAGYIAWQKFEQQHQFLHSQQQQIATLKDQQKNVNNAVEQQLQANNIAQANELKTLHETIAAFLKQNKHARRDWLVNETEYLIKLANHRLILANDIPTAIQALTAADNRLLEIGNPKFIPLRNALAVDIQQLKSVSNIDIVGISAQLAALQQQTDSLPLLTPDPKTIKQRQSEPSNISKIDSWQQLPSAIWQDLLKLFRIQKHNDVIKPLLLPEQRFFLVHNLKLQLEQARLALLSNQPTLFKNRLEQCTQWIKKYFDSQHSLSQATLETLTQLINTNISLNLPDITESLSKLNLLHSDNESKKSRTQIKTPAKTTPLKTKTPKINNSNSQQQRPNKNSLTPSTNSAVKI